MVQVSSRFLLFEDLEFFAPRNDQNWAKVGVMQRSLILQDAGIMKDRFYILKEFVPVRRAVIMTAVIGKQCSMLSCFIEGKSVPVGYEFVVFSVNYQ